MNFLFYMPQMAPYGGIERHVCCLAAAAAAQGHSVRLLTTSNSLGSELRGQLSDPLISFRELDRPRLTAGPVAKIVWLLDEFRRSRDRQWDIIYTNAQTGLARLVWFAAGPDTRVVHHHHTTADAPEQTTWSWNYRRVLRNAPRLIGCSSATCVALNAAVGRDDARFLPYLTSSPVDRCQVVERTPGHPLRFGFCGRLIPEKGIAAILALANDPALTDIEWHIHGEGEAFQPSCFAGRPRLVYHGAYLSSGEHARVLLALDAMVLFSIHNEGMPLSLIEGMSAGLPWIATDRGGTRELAKSPADCLVVPTDASLSQLGGHVRALADRILAGSTCRQRQRASYDQWIAPATVAARWLDFFQS
jgi:glycosyltransferase involved in cell wall biosynthesis